MKIIMWVYVGLCGTLYVISASVCGLLTCLWGCDHEKYQGGHGEFVLHLKRIERNAISAGAREYILYCMHTQQWLIVGVRCETFHMLTLKMFEFRNILVCRFFILGMLAYFKYWYSLNMLQKNVPTSEPTFNLFKYIIMPVQAFPQFSLIGQWKIAGIWWHIPHCGKIIISTRLPLFNKFVTSVMLSFL